jgi:diguanylate cyclase (GGDEF)-like protein
MQPAVLQRLERCSSLPTLPALAVQVLQLCQREELNLSEIAKVLATDPALATKVLRMANSPIMGLRNPAKTVTHAISLLGVNAVRTLALSFSLAQDIKQREKKEKRQQYWKRSILSAIAAQELARALGMAHPEEAFLAGLLQDIGILALKQAMPDVYMKILREADGDHVRLSDLERAQLGGDHAEVGQWLLERWNLPGVLAQAVGASHLAPPTCDKEVERLLKIVSLSGRLADIWVRADAAEATRLAMVHAFDVLGLDEKQLEPVLREIATAMFSEVTRLLEADTGSPQEVNAILEQAKETLLLSALRAEQEAMQVRQSATRLEEKHRALSEESRRDKLTRLFNRECFELYLEEQLDAVRTSQKPLSLLFCDVDHFKKVNDSFGHQAGDQVLVAVARILSERLRQKDLPVRFGGEEFVLVLPETDKAGACTVAERLRKRIEESSVESAGSPIRVTISIGCATLTPGADPSAGSEIVQAADEALYAAKRAGRNRVLHAADSGSTYGAPRALASGSAAATSAPKSPPMPSARAS